MLYTDTKRISDGGAFSVSILREVLETRTSDFVQFKLDIVHRYDQPEQPRLIDKALLAPYDEIWLFGYYQQNAGPVFNDDTGGPRNELEDSERDALAEWMAKGGVLIAGDHSEPRKPGG